MQFTIFTVLALATSAIAVPSKMAKRQNGKGLNPNVIFTNATCKLGAENLLGYPSGVQAFPAADVIGGVLGPVLSQALGATTVNDIDLVAENLCISANQDPADGTGICQNALQAVFDLAVADAGQDQVDKYMCLLNLLCVAQNSPNNAGTCQFLLAGSDCIANRIVGVGDKECTGQYGPYQPY